MSRNFVIVLIAAVVFAFFARAASAQDATLEVAPDAPVIVSIQPAAPAEAAFPWSEIAFLVAAVGLTIGLRLVGRAERLQFIEALAGSVPAWALDAGIDVAERGMTAAEQYANMTPATTDNAAVAEVRAELEETKRQLRELQGNAMTRLDYAAIMSDEAVAK